MGQVWEALDMGDGRWIYRRLDNAPASSEAPTVAQRMPAIGPPPPPELPQLAPPPPTVRPMAARDGDLLDVGGVLFLLDARALRLVRVSP